MKDPKEMALLAAKALSDKKGREIQVLEIGELTTLADYFVIASTTSSTHVKALVDEVEFQLKEKGVEPRKLEGYQYANWIIMDYGDVIVHVFHEETRKFYTLERLWSDGETIDMKELLD